MSELDPSIKKDFERSLNKEIETLFHIENPPEGPHDLLAEQNARLDSEVKLCLRRKIVEAGESTLPSYRNYVSVELNGEINGIIQSCGYDEGYTSVGRPTQRNALTDDVDLAFNAAGMAKAAFQAPLDVAKDISSKLKRHASIADAKASGPFVNIELDYSQFAPAVLEEISRLGTMYGHFRDGEPQVVLVDYSSPNVAKNMTVAHLRSTIIGHSLTKIQAATGNIPFGINHIGDWGTQFGNIIYEYQKELHECGDEFLQELNDNPTATLMRIYRAFNERKDKDPEAVKEAQEIFLRLEKGEPELVQLWDQFKVWSLRDFGPSYDRLGISFDAIQGESFYEDRMNPAVNDAIDKGVLKVNEIGAIVFPAQALTNPSTGVVNEKVMLDHAGAARDEIIVKPNKGTVYLTRDLAAIRYRGRELKADKILYVIGKEQQAHCLELFNMADQMDYMPLGCAEHISFGHLNIDGRKMKTRQGKIALLNDILDESVEAAANMIKGRKLDRGDDSELTEEEWETARRVGIGAIIFNDLRQNREKDIEFNPDTAKTLEAGNSAYIQYTYSRLGSVLEKVGSTKPLDQVPETIADTEKRLLLEMSLFPQAVKEAALLNAPHKIANYLTELCQSANLFYHDQSVAKAASSVEQNFRLNLIEAVRQVISNSANLLHFELPERM